MQVSLVSETELEYNILLIDGDAVASDFVIVKAETSMKHDDAKKRSMVIIIIIVLVLPKKS